MDYKHFTRRLSAHFGQTYTPSQQQAVGRLVDFLGCGDAETLFLLTGYAGTGKTSLVGALVRSLADSGVGVCLLAPTGRAAKVFAASSGLPAHTIHKKIYRRQKEDEGWGIFSLGFNPDKEMLFFVDEASMIGTGSGDAHFGSGSLLDDLFQFVYNGRGCRLIFIGDEAQLPPVGTWISPALDTGYLERHYGIQPYQARLTEVMRQGSRSGIISTATGIRARIGVAGANGLALKVAASADVQRIGHDLFLEELEGCYGKYGEEETVVVCRSNRQANRYNAAIRSRILYREEAFTSGDRVMVVKNNYYWGSECDQMDFIANGEMATVQKVGKQRDLYGFRFAQTRLVLSGNNEELTAWVLLDILESEQPALGAEENRRFYFSVEEDYREIASRQKRAKKVQENEYFNALQIKFAYAITGHKSQGGQWKAVFVDPGWWEGLPLDDAYWRWLYTAVTRAREKLYLVGETRS